MSYDFRPAVEGAAITSALLLAEHIGLWEHRERTHLLLRYVLGTLAIGAGVSHTAHRRGETWPDFWAVAITGGAVVVGAHLVRARRFQQQEMRIDDAVFRRWLEGAG